MMIPGGKEEEDQSKPAVPNHSPKMLNSGYEGVAIPCIYAFIHSFIHLFTHIYWAPISGQTMSKPLKHRSKWDNISFKSLQSSTLRTKKY